MNLSRKIHTYLAYDYNLASLTVVFVPLLFIYSTISFFFVVFHSVLSSFVFDAEKYGANNKKLNRKVNRAYKIRLCQWYTQDELVRYTRVAAMAVIIMQFTTVIYGYVHCRTVKSIISAESRHPKLYIYSDDWITPLPVWNFTISIRWHLSSRRLILFNFRKMQDMLFCGFDLRKSQTERKASMIIIINCVTPHSLTLFRCKQNMDNCRRTACILLTFRKSTREKYRRFNDSHRCWNPTCGRLKIKCK